jgi:RHS repeat-associated protein
VLGVSLASGTPSGSGPKLDVGTGGFPYELTANLAWRAGVPVDNGLAPIIPTQPQAGWTSNWSNNLALSGSGLEAMGESDIREAVGAIAAFYAEQDIYKSSPSVQRDVAAVLTQAWWAHQIASNVATVTVGPSAQQFVQLPPGVTLPGSSVNWFAPGGTYATMTMTGSRSAYEFICSGPPTPPYAMSRGWDSSGLSFAITSASGDVQHFAYWGMTYATSDSPTAGNCGQAKGFRLTSWTFPSGMAVTLTYGNGYPPSGGGDTIDTLVSVQNSLGRKIGFTFAGSTLTGFDNGLTGGDLRHVTLTPGGGIPFEYTAMTDPIGAVTHHTYLAPLITSSTQRPVPYDLLSQVFTADNASLPNLQYDYDGLGRVKQVRDALNLQGGGRAPWQFFIADGTRGERDDPLGGKYAVTYDIFNHPWRYIDEIGRETDEIADGRGRILSTTYPEGDQEVFTYDVRNNPLSLTRVPKPGSPLANIVLSASYGEASTIAACANPVICNERVSSTSGNGAVTNITYDSATGLPTQTLLPADPAGNRPRTDYAYSTFGSGFILFTSQTQYITPTATTVTSFTYSSSNDYVPLTATVDSGSGKLNLTTTLAFDAQGSITQINGPRSDMTDVSDFTWDADRRIVFNIQPDPDGAGVNPRPANRTTYDAVGRVIQTDRGTTTLATGGDFVPALAVTTAYDPDSNKIRETTPTRVTQFSYDGANRALCTAVRMNPAIYGSLPSDACALGAQGTFGPDRIAKTTYDAAGQVLVQQRAFGTALVQAYATNTWTANGQLASVYDADGPTHVTNYTYDGFDRLSITAFADSAVGHLDLEQVARYDADNNPLVRITRSAQMLTYAYDALDRVCIKVMTAPDSTPPADCHATAQPSPAVTTFSTYDLLNRATGATDTNGNTLATVYDNASRITSATRTTPLLSAKTVTYAYDPAGNRTQLTWPDGYYAQYTYDALNHPTAVVDSVGTTLASYTYDTLARRIGLQYNGATGAKMAYSWSAEDDLLTQGSDLAVGGNLAATANDVAFTHSFTPAHQWATATISNPAFRYMPATTATTPYAAANVLNQYGTVGGVAQTYDTRGNLTSDGTRTYTYDTENRLLTATASGLAAAYAYDPMGRRTAKTVNSTVTAFVHDGDSEIAEYDGTGTLQRRFVPGPTTDEYIAMVTAAGVRTYFHTDKMGSVIAMSDASGNLVEGPYTYDAYGNCFSGGIVCGAGGVPFRFTGQRYDPETGLYYYRARYYDPRIGRFLQTDPVGYKDDLNLYLYVHDDPTDKTDPTGKCEPFCGAIIGAVIGGGLEAGSQLLQTGHVSNWRAVGREALIGGIAGATGAGIGALALKAGRVFSIASKLAPVVAGAVAGGTQSALHGNGLRQVAEDTVVGAVAGGAAGGLGKAVQRVAGARAANAAEGTINREAQGGNLAAQLVQSGALTSGSNSGPVTQGAAAGVVSEKATDAALQAADRYRKGH